MSIECASIALISYDNHCYRPHQSHISKPSKIHSKNLKVSAARHARESFCHSYRYSVGDLKIPEIHRDRIRNINYIEITSLL